MRTPSSSELFIASRSAGTGFKSPDLHAAGIMSELVDVPAERLSVRGQLKRDDAILLVIDVQERLVAVMPDRDKVVAATVRLIEGAKALSVPVILTEQYPKGLGPTVPAVREVIEENALVEKLSFSCCGEKGFDPLLESSGKRSVVIAGMEAHICVLQTSLALLERGYDVHVVGDAVSSRAPENRDTALDLLRDAGATVTTTEIVLFQLLERAGTPEFKAVSALVK